MIKNILLALALLCTTSATLLPVGEQERDILYAMHAIGKDFSEIEFLHNPQNLAMFISFFKINSDVLEAKLVTARQQTKGELIKQVGLLGLTTGVRCAIPVIVNKLYRHYSLLGRLDIFVSLATSTVLQVVCAWSALNIYDVFKEKNKLQQALALDKEILEKLEELGNMLLFSSEDAQEEVINSQQTENPVLESTISS